MTTPIVKATLAEQFRAELLDELAAENPFASDEELEAMAEALEQAEAELYALEWGLWHTEWDDVMIFGRGD